VNNIGDMHVESQNAGIIRRRRLCGRGREGYVITSSKVDGGEIETGCTVLHCCDIYNL